MEAATEAQIEDKPEGAVSSFAKSLFLGEIHEEMVFPWPAPDAEEQEQIRDLSAAAREIGSRMDHRAIEEERWIGDDVIRRARRGRALRPLRRRGVRRPGALADRLRRVFETFAQIDATLSIVLGVHQSIGYQGHRHCSAPTSRRSASCPTSPPGASSPASR